MSQIWHWIVAGSTVDMNSVDWGVDTRFESAEMRGVSVLQVIVMFNFITRKHVFHPFYPTKYFYFPSILCYVEMIRNAIQTENRCRWWRNATQHVFPYSLFNNSFINCLRRLSAARWCDRPKRERERVRNPFITHPLDFHFLPSTKSCFVCIVPLNFLNRTTSPTDTQQNVFVYFVCSE